MRQDRPTLSARFVLDQTGRPEMIPSSTAPGLKHYKIELQALEAPSSAEAITYELDPSYFDPVREITRVAADDSFPERITSYGDYVVRLGVAGSTGAADATLLSEALKRGHQDDLQTNEAVRQALEDIRGR